MRLPVVCAVAALIAAGCGGDDDDDTPAAATEEGNPTAGQTSSDSPADTTSAPLTDASAGDGAGEAATAAQPGECPSAEAVSAAWGAAFELDEANATTGAIGLVFCPYEEVIAPGTTDQFGDEPLGEFFSITLTAQNPVMDDPTADRVDGLGEAGTWHDGAGELSVWTGERGVIVSVTFPPDGVDAFELAARLAGIALGVDASAATITPAHPAAVEAAAAERAAGCPDAAQVGAAAGRELVLGEGAVAEGGSGLCPYLAVADDPYSFTVNLGFSLDAIDPIDPTYDSEEISGVGDRAVWQDYYHLLWVVTGGQNVTIQVSGVDLSDADERAIALAVAETIV